MSMDRAAGGTPRKDILDEVTISPDRENHYRTSGVISKFRDTINSLDTDTEKTSTIAATDCEESVPALIRILLEIRDVFIKQKQAIINSNVDNNNNNNNVELVTHPRAKRLAKIDGTLVSLSKALNIFGEADRVLQELKKINPLLHPVKAYDLVKHINKDDTLKGLVDLVNNSKNIYVTNDTIKLWKEVTIYLCGIYRRTADKIPHEDGVPQRDKNGEFKRVDMGDTFFYGKTKLTKMEVSLYYRKVQQEVETLMARYEARKGMKAERKRKKQLATTAQVITAAAQAIQANPAAVNAPAVVTTSTPEVSTASPVRMPSLVAINNPAPTPYILQTQGMVPCLMSVMETDDEDPEYSSIKIKVLKKDMSLLQNVGDYAQSLFGSPVLKQLKEDMHLDPDSRITNFAIVLKEYGFTPTLNKMMQHFRRDAINVLNRYVTNVSRMNPSRYLGQGVLFGIFDPSNTDLVAPAISALNASSDIREQVLIIVRLRSDVYGRHSTTIYPALTEFLLKEISRLCPQQERQAVLHRESSQSDVVPQAWFK